MKAVIVGVDGQDGRILKDYLKERGWQVYGINRNYLVIDEGEKRPFSIYDRRLVSDFIAEITPDHIYYLAGFHHSSEDEFSQGDIAEESYKVHFLGLINVLEAMRKGSAKTRLFYAGSSLMYGSPPLECVTEDTPFTPDCIYGITKLSGYHAVRMFRNSFGLFAVTGIMFNHESIFRRENFFSKKVIKRAIEIKRGLAKELIVGDLSSKTDWGYALDFVRAMFMMLSADVPDDYIVATGELHSVEEFVRIVFSTLGLDWRLYVKEDRGILKRKKPNFCGSYAKIFNALGWKPSLSFEEMVKRLVEEALKNG